jgi:hypothetical protein
MGNAGRFFEKVTRGDCRGCEARGSNLLKRRPTKLHHLETLPWIKVFPEYSLKNPNGCAKI